MVWASPTITLKAISLSSTAQRSVSGGRCLAETIKLPSPDQGFSLRERRIKDKDLQNIRLWWEWLRKTSKSFIGREWNDLRSVSDAHGNGLITNNLYEATDMRKLFTNSIGRLGTGNASLDHPIYHHMEIKVGNEFHVAFGNNIPFLLRPVVDLVSTGRLRGEQPCSRESMTCHHGIELVYQLIGICYVDGIMDGEAMDDTIFQKAQIFFH